MRFYSMASWIRGLPISRSRSRLRRWPEKCGKYLVEDGTGATPEHDELRAACAACPYLASPPLPLPILFAENRSAQVLAALYERRTLAPWRSPALVSRPC